MSKALLTMTQKSFGCIGVINKKKQIVGLITDGDLRRKLNSKFFDRTAAEIMTKRPVSIDKNELAAKALSLMNSKTITSLCVYEKKNKSKTIGVLHIHNILQSNIT